MHTFSTSVEFQKYLILLFIGKKPYFENHGHQAGILNDQHFRIDSKLW
ncbi:hypothetical protein LEP1GSC204_0168 [Leptospira interrogans serovar Copenhageni str. M20]|uniref:Uncharacterized protein n=2 Tax=Leptospira interrogans TaxID=173 RepID=A0A0F6HFD9_LEPIR|nr:hypothetical protein G436_0700 [Leptospira interrogans serovar Hardjo str. Norma]EKO27084.1 hypothetical protein LEP1GSC104_0912 [Leptospira interrogans str. UI 12621]EKO70704.1 hypothetical protein LEP1GSC069_0871 [Leptospira interrogans serovar Canicola str. Fiocruz LV133]EMF34028.1 hypothetical protein LEP1GSC201_3379 [Leptospira interrogans serovar Pomona str. Fox 32256]EMI69547.1 hypothetical protein LEP1GSC200_1499 [Leptospira interrogans serovar Pomona str. CSL10083]EMJ63667.1 hypoth